MNRILHQTAMVGLASIGMAAPLRDKTLVVWAAPSNLVQLAGSALTIDDGQSHFDGVVFGELTPRKWMAGSDNLQRTQKEQATWPAENAVGKTFVQIAIVYRGRDVSIYRNGLDYARYTMPNPPQLFGPQAVVLFGKRHLDAADPENSFTGRIEDARIYDLALDRKTIAAMKPGEVAGGIEP